MKKMLSLLLLFSLGVGITNATDIQKVKPVKNVILLIPDGTSLQTVSLARWCQWYRNPDKPHLNIDPYICGTVRSFCSNGPVGDSAPTTSCYMTGYPSIAGFVSTHPYSAGNDDIYPVDPDKAFQPLATVLEASRILKNKATGLVFVCEFPHATPADCASHSYQRGNYKNIAPQMVHNKVDVVLGGGTSYLNEEGENFLKNNGYGVFKDDLKGFRSYEGNKMWALFGKGEMEYDLDRNPEEQPSLAEMTAKAIEKLSKNENGFFLMVEGSLVDHAGHGNDPVGLFSDFLAFDKACGVALDFAKKNGETAIIIVPDHGTGGPSITGGSSYSKTRLFKTLSGFKRTAAGLAKIVNSRPAEELPEIFKEYGGIRLTDKEIDAFYNCKGYDKSPIPKDQRKDKKEDNVLYNNSLTGLISDIITARSTVRFTTSGHTAEELFLAAYHPKENLQLGMIDNIEVNHLLCNLLGVGGELDNLTASLFAKHYDVFKGMDYEIIPAEENGNPTLIVNGKKKIEIQPFTNIIKVDGKEEQLNSVIVYVDRTNTFYLPQNLTELAR